MLYIKDVVLENLHHRCSENQAKLISWLQSPCVYTPKPGSFFFFFFFFFKATVLSLELENLCLRDWEEIRVLSDHVCWVTSSHAEQLRLQKYYHLASVDEMFLGETILILSPAHIPSYS